MLYAERIAAGNWSYWDAGPASSEYPAGGIFRRLYAVAFDSAAADARPVVVRRSAYDGVFQYTYPLENAVPLDLAAINPTCGSQASQKPDAWSTIAPADNDLPVVFFGDVSQVNGAVTQTHGKTAEQRVMYSCSPGAPRKWGVVSVDRANNYKPFIGAGPVVVNGTVQKIYTWGQGTHAGSEPQGRNEPMNATAPNHYVLLASQAVGALCPGM